MKPRIIVLIVAGLFSHHAGAQMPGLRSVVFAGRQTFAEAMLPTNNDSTTAASLEYDVLEHQGRAMNVLLGWSGVSVSAGTVMLFNSSRIVRDFGIQNIAWGAIDAGIALWAKNAVDDKRQAGFDKQAERESFRKILLINTGLDILYVIVGVVLLSSGKENLKGHGMGILVQGSFLFVFDGLNYLLAGG